MVENVERHIHGGKRPFQAAIDAARELVGPIIAMTITLAAVYAPVGIQGGLTGALFREFAFTLAGAVIVSGVVALTLSPMMGAKLLRAGQSERGFAGWINRRFAGLRGAYTRTLAGTLRYRPVVLVFWVIVVLLMVPFYMFSQQELAPAEDQGVVFSILQTSANSTIDQTKLFAEQVAEVYRSLPETAGIFQLDVSDRRLRRLRDQAVERTDQDDPAAADRGRGSSVADPRHPRDSAHASTAPRRRRFPGRPGDRIGRRAAAASRVRQPARAEGIRERPVHVRRCRHEVRSTASGSGVRSRQAAVAGSQPEPGRPRSLDAAGRRLRQPVQQPGAQLQGDPAGEADGAADARSTVAPVRHGLRQQARAAVHLRQHPHHARSRAS